MIKNPAVEELAQYLNKMTGDFCNQYLDQDYKNLCDKMIAKMSRKRVAPYLYGKLEVWAASIIYAIGSINFLYDPSFKPYVSTEDISSYFGVSKSTVYQKAKVIRDMFKLGHLDPEFSTEYMKEYNPFNDLMAALWEDLKNNK